jgi:sugar-specific transcriptional regulator TrmB
MIDKTIDDVLACLRSGLDTANSIRHKLGVEFESVYQALVTLEGRGFARVILTKQQRYSASWGAL